MTPGILARVKKTFPSVRVIRDAKVPVVVTVTAKDRKRGKVLKNSECALAVACKRQFHLDGAIINLAISYLIRGRTAYRYKTPNSVSREIVSFDRSGDFADGEYTLGPVPPSQSIGKRPKKAPTGPKLSARTRGIIHRTARVRHA